MKLYDCQTAPSPRRVRIFLAEKGLSIDTVQVGLGKGEQLGNDFRKINPDCVVPALQLDDGSCIPALAERGHRRVVQFFDRLNDQLAGNDFVAGENFSIADISAMVLVDFAGWVKISIPEDASNLARWYGDVSKRPSAAS